MRSVKLIENMQGVHQNACVYANISLDTMEISSMRKKFKAGIL